MLREYKACKVELVDELDSDIVINPIIISVPNLEKETDNTKEDESHDLEEK